MSEQDYYNGSNGIMIRQPDDLNPWLWVKCPATFDRQLKNWGEDAAAVAINHGHSRATYCLDCEFNTGFLVNGVSGSLMHSRCMYKHALVSA